MIQYNGPSHRLCPGLNACLQNGIVISYFKEEINHWVQKTNLSIIGFILVFIALFKMYSAHKNNLCANIFII